ncbi:MAG TPA: hypothetical protein VGG99_21610 [Acetobacteraceae bacterium]|jgi:hypothetical protein
MQAWAQFYTTVATAAAGLLGLLFVVVSINVSATLGPEAAVSRRLTEQAFQNYLAVMLVAFLALFPGISTTTFGMVILVTTAGGSAWVVIRLCQTLAFHIRRGSWGYSLRRHVSSLIGFGILLVSAFRMALDWGESYNWLAASTLILLISATAVSWELLKQMTNRPS